MASTRDVKMIGNIGHVNFVVQALGLRRLQGCTIMIMD